MNTKINIIVALAEKNRAIGKDNKLLWHIPEDLRRFKEITFGHPVVMGRKTFESIGRLLPGRLNIIVTRDKTYTIDASIIHVNGAVKICHSLDEALEYAGKNKELFIIGGGEIFRQAMPIADKLYLTLVTGDFEGDAFFPDYSEFTKVVSEKKSEGNGYIYRFVELMR